MNFFKIFQSLIHPHKCVFCRDATDYDNYTYICKKCMSSLPFIGDNRCAKCGIPIGENALPVCHTCRKYHHSFSRSFTPLIYEKSVRTSILSMKFGNKESYCHAYAFLITNRILEEGFPHIDFITYVPLSMESYKIRGFNQSQLIAEECGKILNLPVISAVERIDGTPRQSSLSLSERRKNAKRAFKAKEISLYGTALLIDDVYTTGSTMSFISSLLLNMGCERVFISAVALRGQS